MLAQQPLGERVEGADGGPVQLVERGLAQRLGTGFGRRVGRLLLQRPAHPVAQLGRRLLGESDRGDGG